LISHMSTWGVWICYFLAQALHLLLGAHLSIHSKLNSVGSYREYFSLRIVPILCRVFLTTLVFLEVWYNQSVLDLSRFTPTIQTQVAMAGILGWFSDSLFDKFLALIPGLQKELPAMDCPPQP
jgi:hypothetical protein